MVKLLFLTDEWQHNDKWLKFEAKVLKTNKSGKSNIIGGILYDVTNYRDYKDLEYLYSIHELAIQSGNIGVFHYNLDKHSPLYFDANHIYAKILGIEQQPNGLYLLDDFSKSIMDLEEDLSSNEDVRNSLNNLMEGAIEGTNEEIIKIKNQKNGDIKYLMSSSKIEGRFEDGTPRHFGGVVIDITDRIISEINQIQFAYTDELTRLPNNRKLMKDMRNRVDGIGPFFDLDNFKKVNDSHGHLYGDKVLKIFADGLSYVSNKYSNVIPYRLYGDEFFVFVEGKDVIFATEFENTLLPWIKAQVDNLDKKVVLEASMGVSKFKKGMDISEFIKLADYSMYKTKIKKKEQ